MVSLELCSSVPKSIKVPRGIPNINSRPSCPGQSRRGNLREESLRILRLDLSRLLRMTLLNAL